MLQFFVVMSDFSTKHLCVAQEVQQILDQKFREQAEAFRVGFTPTDFDAGWGPEADEIFRASPFQLPDQFKRCVRNPRNCDDITREELVPGAIRAVVGVSVDNNGIVEQAIFKRIDSSKVIDRSKTAFIMYDADTLNISRENVLIIPDRVDALFVDSDLHEDGDLYFFSLYTTKQFLPLDQLFREATNADIDHLLETGTLVCDNRENFESILDSWSRRRLSMIMERPIWESVPVSDIDQQARRFGVTLNTRITQEGRSVIILPEERKALKDVLRVLNEDLIQAQLTNNRWQINSKKPV